MRYVVFKDIICYLCFNSSTQLVDRFVATSSRRHAVAFSISRRRSRPRNATRTEYDLSRRRYVVSTFYEGERLRKRLDKYDSSSYRSARADRRDKVKIRAHTTWKVGSRPHPRDGPFHVRRRALGLSPRCRWENYVGDSGRFCVERVLCDDKRVFERCNGRYPRLASQRQGLSQPSRWRQVSSQEYRPGPVRSRRGVGRLECPSGRRQSVGDWGLECSLARFPSRNIFAFPSSWLVRSARMARYRAGGSPLPMSGR